MNLLPNPQDYVTAEYKNSVSYQDSPTTHDTAYPYDVVMDMLKKAIEDTRNATLIWAADNAKVKEVYQDARSTTYDGLECVRRENSNGADSYISIDADSILLGMEVPELQVK